MKVLVFALFAVVSALLPLPACRAPTDDIRVQGHWATDVLLRHYSRVLPLGALKGISFFDAQRKCYFIHRQILELPPGICGVVLICYAPCSVCCCVR